MSDSRENGLAHLLKTLDRVERARIHCHLAHVRDAVMLIAAVPGERWEIEFFEDGHVEIERFVSTGAIEEEDKIDLLISKHGS